MIERTPGYWKYGISSADGMACWVILDSNGKQMPSERPLGDVKLYANSAEMYDLLWKVANEFHNSGTQRNSKLCREIMNLLARVNVIPSEGTPQFLINKVEKLNKELEAENE